MEILIYAANGMYVSAYFMTDMLRMRLLSITGATCLAVYFYCQPEPMLTIVGWNTFFIALNLLQVARIIRLRKMKTQGPRGTALHSNAAAT